jgi:predicted RNA binding protein YcfA (HicA-like mRNA interferase family)
MKILEQNGFKRILVIRGDHARFAKMTERGYCATTVQINKEIPVSMIHKIIRQTGKPPDEFK